MYIDGLSRKFVQENAWISAAFLVINRYNR